MNNMNKQYEITLKKSHGSSFVLNDDEKMLLHFVYTPV